MRAGCSPSKYLVVFHDAWEYHEDHLNVGMFGWWCLSYVGGICDFNSFMQMQQVYQDVWLVVRAEAGLHVCIITGRRNAWMGPQVSFAGQAWAEGEVWCAGLGGGMGMFLAGPLVEELKGEVASSSPLDSRRMLELLVPLVYRPAMKVRLTHHATLHASPPPASQLSCWLACISSALTIEQDSARLQAGLHKVIGNCSCNGPAWTAAA